MKGEIIVVPRAIVDLLWRDPDEHVRALRPIDGVPGLIRTKVVTVRLQPGESASVQVGPREYVTVRRPGVVIERAAG